MKIFTWNKYKKSYASKTYLLIWFAVVLLLWSMECLGYIYANRAAKSLSTWLIHTTVMFTSIYILTILCNICLKPLIKQAYIKEITALIIANLLYFLINPFMHAQLIPGIQFVNQINLFGSLFQIIIYSIVYALVNHVRFNIKNRPNHV